MLMETPKYEKSCGIKFKTLEERFLYQYQNLEYMVEELQEELDDYKSCKLKDMKVSRDLVYVESPCLRNKLLAPWNCEEATFLGNKTLEELLEIQAWDRQKIWNFVTATPRNTYTPNPLISVKYTKSITAFNYLDEKDNLTKYYFFKYVDDYGDEVTTIQQIETDPKFGVWVRRDALISLKDAVISEFQTVILNRINELKGKE